LDEVVGVVIAAAGKGQRMKTDINKQFLLLAGQPVLKYSVETFSALKEVSQVVVVAHPQEVEHCRRLLGNERVQVVAGGKERQDSVYLGLRTLAQDTKLVAVHDGARPLLSSALVLSLLHKATEWGAVIPAVPVKDTLKEVTDDGVIVSTLDRTKIWQAQTPQVFPYRSLVYAYEQAVAEGFYATDDASLYERYCGRVRVITGDYRNIKITTPDDLLIAEALIRASRSDSLKERNRQ